MKVAVIPARGGSKRIPRKNIRPFMGRPMIAHSIEAAQACALFDRILVSTDDEEIAVVARSHGAEVPFMRPPELSDDFANTTAVIASTAQMTAKRPGSRRWLNSMSDTGLRRSGWNESRYPNSRAHSRQKPSTFHQETGSRPQRPRLNLQNHRHREPK